MLKLSASKLSRVRDCPRQAAFYYWGGLPKPPPGPGAELGSRLHAVAEAYLRDGIAPERGTDVGDMLLAALRYLPPPGSGHVEGRFDLQVSGLHYMGFLDYEGPSDAIPGAPKGLPAILDHKTSRDPKRYGLRPETALQDVQVLVYAVKALVDNPEAGAVFGRWVYYKTGLKRPKVYPVDFLLTREDVVRHFGEVVHPAAVAMTQLQQLKPNPNTVLPNTASCDNYGGCPYRAHCKLSEPEKAQGFLSEPKTKEQVIMSLLESLKAASAAAPAPAPQAVNPPPVAALAPVAAPAPVAPAPVAAPEEAQPLAITREDKAQREALALRVGFAVLDVVEYAAALVRKS